MAKPSTIKALAKRKADPAKWNDYKRRNNDVSRLRAFAEGRKWSNDHIEMVKDWTGTDREPALLIGRSACAIKMLRVRQSLIRPIVQEVRS